MKYTKETIKGWIEKVNDEAAKPLTKWEKSFMESITDRFERTGHLTDSQIEVLEGIYAEKV